MTKVEEQRAKERERVLGTGQSWLGWAGLLGLVGWVPSEDPRGTSLSYGYWLCGNPVIRAGWLCWELEKEREAPGQKGRGAAGGQHKIG